MLVLVPNENGEGVAAPAVLDDWEPNAFEKVLVDPKIPPLLGLPPVEEAAGKPENPNGDFDVSVIPAEDSFLISFPSTSSPQDSTTTVSSGRCFAFVFNDPIFLTTSIPSMTV